MLCEQIPELEVVKAFNSPKLFLAEIPKLDFDLCILDIEMPEMNGYDATKLIRGFNKKVIIVAQSAYAFMGDKEKSIETGFNDYISKPFKNVTFTELMEKHFKNTKKN